MKTLTVLFLLFCFTTTQTQTQSFEVIAVDTINKIDIHNWKQGKWIIRGMHYFTGKTKVISGFRPDQVVEAGMYKNNRKEGEWIEYYKNGKMRNKLTYVNGVLDGSATFYDNTGKVLKEGKFKGNKWINN